MIFYSGHGLCLSKTIHLKLHATLGKYDMRYLVSPFSEPKVRGPEKAQLMCVLNSQALFPETLFVSGQVDPSLTCWVGRRISLRKTKQTTRRKPGLRGDLQG